MLRRISGAGAAGLLIGALFSLAAPLQAQQASDSIPVIEGRWSVEKINQWYADLPWLVGANYVPRNAINQLEMWQADTFSPDAIDKELGWASEIGMNTMRVFLHDIVWRENPKKFLGA